MKHGPAATRSPGGIRTMAILALGWLGLAGVGLALVPPELQDGQAAPEAVVLPDRGTLADRLFLQASLAEMKGDWRQARANYQRVLELDSTLSAAAEALFELGLRAGDREAQDRAGRWLLAWRPEHPALDRWLDRLYLDGDPSSVEDALAHLPADSHLLLRLQLELDRPDAAAARERILRGLELGAEGGDSLVGDGDLFWEQVFGYARRFERLQEARDWIAGSSWAAGSAWAWHVQARIAWLQQDLDGAFAAIGRAARLDSVDADLPLLEGRLALASGDDGRACAALQRADRLDPGNPDILEPWALACERDGRLERAAVLQRLLLAAAPERQESWLSLASFHERHDQVELAISIYREAIGLFGAQAAPVLLNNLAYTLAVQGRDLEEALELVRRALAAEPESPSYLDTLGWTLFRLGRLDEAAAPLEEALARTTPLEAAEILEHLGALRAAQGRLDEAREAYERALELNPDNDGPRQALRALTPESPPRGAAPQQATE